MSLRSSAKNNPPRARGIFRGILLLTLLAAAAAPGQPGFRIEGGSKFDFGELFTLLPVARELTITNTGDDTLRLSQVSGSCGCTGTLLSNDAIPPGGNGTLRITFDPAKFNGGVEKVVSMRTNDPKEPNPHIYFTAKISKILELDQDHLLFYTAPDSETHTTITIRNLSGVPVRITGVTSSPPDVKATLGEHFLPPDGQTDLVCSITPTAPGILKGDLVISTDHPSIPSLTLRYFCYAQRKKAGNTPSGNR